MLPICGLHIAHNAGFAACAWKGKKYGKNFELWGLFIVYAMSILDYLLIAIAIIIPGGIPVYLYWKYRTKKFNEAEAQLKESINNFTDALVEAAQDGLQEGLESEVRETPDGVKYKTTKSSYLSDTQYLTTLLTTIVKKSGTIKLSEEDFTNISKTDYISLYVDMKTNDIILKSHNTETKGDITPYMAPATDEDVFH